MRKGTNKFVKKTRIFISHIMGKKSKRNPLTFEVHIIDSCNLNCKGCFHFSSLQDNCEFAIYDLEEFENDFKRLSTLFGNKIGWIHIMGGEPLLNKNVIKYLEIAKKYFSKTDISLLTNGILLPNKIDVIDYCSKNDICISITKYPVGFNYDKIEKVLKEHNCKYEFFGDRSKETSMMNVSLNCKNTCNYKNNFLNCNLSNVCITLDRGKLFYCSVPAYVRIYNKKMNTNFEWENDFVDIYKNDKKQILNFLRTPHKFCGYCDLKYRKENRCKWETTKKERSEWEITENDK